MMYCNNHFQRKEKHSNLFEALDVLHIMFYFIFHPAPLRETTAPAKPTRMSVGFVPPMKSSSTINSAVACDTDKYLAGLRGYGESSII
ncbi:hypothetical protein CEXT_149711 [Caerostris extrusa]|uniref:Uncharacterized protein n=1 Tax=Caerostris extrusa TaxID=172846 RepID=A0AAV4XQ57_CAEEX|nr:hypothetical protein CEXT_149711 [Caerostris extrusa]